jgi:NodT family efflux transporter outer membrane factor (OMF) lipoprotein
MTFRRALHLLPLALLAGCMVGPDYQRPATPTPVAYKELAGWKPGQPRDTIDRGAWWEIFGDPVLNDLEAQIEVSSQTLRQAEAAYRQSQAIVAEARAQLYPTVTADFSDTRSKGGGSSASTLRSGGARVSAAPRTNYNLQAQASWSLDVWGRIRRGIEGDVASAQASAADLASARLSLQSELAIDYLQLRQQDALKTLLDQTIADYTRSLQITQNQYDAGIAARSDVISAQTQLKTTQAQAIGVGVQRAQLEHAIALLTGKPPSELTIATGTLPAQMPDLPTAIPSTLLERRPDIAASERQVAQANANIGVAVAAFYPDISLSALYGFVGDPLGSLITASNHVWSLGAATTETLFSGGARSGAVDAAWAAYDQSVASYRQTVLAGFRQVEDELAALRILADQAVAEADAVASSQQAVQILLNEYRAGIIAFTGVITAQATALADEEQALSIQASRLVAAVTLIEALGGGWDASQLPADIETPNPLIPTMFDKQPSGEK